MSEGTPRIEGYRIGRLIGHGGMAAVYEAWRETDDKRVAIKVIARHLATDPEFRKRFAREVEVASQLEHPHAVKLVDSRIDPDAGGFLAMEFIEGPNLQERLDATGRLSVAEATRIVEQVAAALDEAHRLGLVHRDVKPANVLLDESSSAYLGDFGLARDLAATRLTTTGAWLGTIDYAAPEQIRGAGVDARTDVYALAALAFHVLSGEVPFPRDDHMATMWAHVHEPRPSLPGASLQHAGAASEVITRGMAIDPDDRHPSAGDFARALTSAAREGATVRMPEQSVARGAAAPSQATTLAETVVAKGSRGKRAALIGSIVAMLALALAAGGYFAFDPLGGDGGEGDDAAVADSTPVSAPAPQPTPEPEPIAEPAECSRTAAEQATLDSGFADAIDTTMDIQDELAGTEGSGRPRVNFDPVGGYQVFELECRDLTGNGVDEMVVGLGAGAAGRVFQWAIFTSNAEGEWDLAFERVGSQVTSLRIRGEAVIVRTPTYEPDDPLCCPSGRRVTEIAYDGEEFRVVSPVASEEERLIEISESGIRRLGEFDPRSGSPLETWVFGTPTSFYPVDERCPYSWSDLGLTINFAHLGGRDPCGPQGRVGNIELLGTPAEQAGWVTSAGLRVGMPVAEAREIYPDAKRRRGDLVLLEQPSPIGSTGFVDVLTAKVTEGRIWALIIFVGAAGE